jgi:replicative DNA helicase
MCGAQMGKALALDTPLPTPGGWTTMRDVRPGDYLLDETGLPARVTGISRVMRDHQCYRVRFSDGASIVADAEHRWAVSRT